MEYDKKREDLAVDADGDVTLQLKVRADLYKAYQRCTWILINETGKKQLDIMNETIRDFLIKHGC